MEKDKVPQDEGITAGITREVQYAVDENGKYVKTLSKGWEAKNIVNELAWEDNQEFWNNGEYFTEMITKKAVEYLREAAKSDRPFFLYYFCSGLGDVFFDRCRLLVCCANRFFV